jgi:hypothetical protein
MATKVIWNCIEALASALEGDRLGVEQVLSELEQELNRLSKRRRDEVRRMIVVIVAGLSRLEVRMKEADGPLDAVY